MRYQGAQYGKQPTKLTATILMRDEDILLAINSRCQDPISDQNTIAEITWFGTDREIFLEVHIEPFNPKLMISHPEKYESIKNMERPVQLGSFRWSSWWSWGIERGCKRERTAHNNFALRRKPKIQIESRNLYAKIGIEYSFGQFQMEGSNDYGAFQESSQYPARCEV